MHNSLIEQVETKYPSLVERYELQTSRRCVSSPCRIGREPCVRGSRANVGLYHHRAGPLPSVGLEGRLEGLGNDIGVRKGGKWQTCLPNAKVAQTLQPGESFLMRPGGGSAFGDPRERNRADLAHDMREGYVTIEIDIRDHSAVIDRDTGCVDVTTTQANGRLRADDTNSHNCGEIE